MDAIQELVKTIAVFCKQYNTPFPIQPDAPVIPNRIRCQLVLSLLLDHRRVLLVEFFHDTLPTPKTQIVLAIDEFKNPDKREAADVIFGAISQYYKEQGVDLESLVDRLHAGEVV